MRVPGRSSADPSWGRRVRADLLARPVVATGRGGSGTRLLSLALQELGVFLGDRLNDSGDSVDWVDLTYGLVKAQSASVAPPAAEVGSRLLENAESILLRGRGEGTRRWGWKLPETMLIVPEVARAFPEAQFVQIVRHPVDICLRRTHLTSRTNNPVGAVALPAAYRSLGWQRDPSADPGHVRNAASWVHQVDRVMRAGKELGSRRYLSVRYEDLCTDPQRVSDALARYLDLPTTTTRLEEIIDLSRCRLWTAGDERAKEVWDICESVGTRLGYRFQE